MGDGQGIDDELDDLARGEILAELAREKSRS
jgi:hypothetical protein